MNADHDRLEAELADMRPVDPSPALRERLSRQLEPGQLVHWTRGRRLLLGVGLAAAASVLVALLTGRNQPTAPIPGSKIGPLPRVAAVSPSPPTLFAYEQALNESEESFVALLDQHEPDYAANATSFETVTVSSLFFNDLSGDR
jgi:hypothetical protein